MLKATNALKLVDYSRLAKPRMASDQLSALHSLLQAKKTYSGKGPIVTITPENDAIHITGNRFLCNELWALVDGYPGFQLTFVVTENNTQSSEIKAVIHPKSSYALVFDSEPFTPKARDQYPRVWTDILSNVSFNREGNGNGVPYDAHLSDDCSCVTLKFKKGLINIDFIEALSRHKHVSGVELTNVEVPRNSCINPAHKAWNNSYTMNNAYKSLNCCFLSSSMAGIWSTAPRG